MVQPGDYESNLMVIANAEPYEHKKVDGEITYEKVVGGLTTALDPLMQENGKAWIGWGRGEEDYNDEVVDEDNVVRVPPDAPEDKKYDLKRVKLSEEEVESFYRGFSNQELWPIGHTFPGKANHREKYWDMYKEVNKKYVDSVLEMADGGENFMVNDYQLSLVPKYLSEETQDAKIGFVWHIPWPPWESIGRLPRREELLEGISGADVVTVHTPSYREHLLEFAENLGADVDREEGFYELDDEKTRVEALPLGIDYDRFSPDNTKVERDFGTGFKEAIGTDHIIIGLDRTDYTKGISERLEAYEAFLKDNPEYQEEVTLFQKVTPSRQKIKEYKEILNDIQKNVARINSQLGSIETYWDPVKLRQKKIPHENLKALYQSADMALITPGIDGKNLVASEYVASHTEEDPGVLILSEFAGAADQFKEEIDGKGPLYANPYDTRETSQKIKQGLEMDEEERIERWRNTDEVVKEKDVEWWRNKFLDLLKG
ncbi:MAG: trehalose-6-phosphate synthase [Candidatus Aenigmatarchaeota archaeon]